MKCPVCEGQTKVFNSRLKQEGLWRRRECMECLTRFTTYETVDYESIDKHLQDRILERS